MNMEDLKIVSLTVENIKKVGAAYIKPNGNLVQITGKNEQGKSSVLDAIWWALAGASHIQSRPIRDGEDKAYIKLDLGEIIVERRFTETSSRLFVATPDGAKYGSPQTILDGILGAICFDPLEFVNDKPERQFESLKRITGLELDDIEAEIKDKFEARTSANRALAEHRVILSKFDVEETEPVDVDALLEKMQKASDHNAEIEQHKRIVERQTNNIKDLRQRAIERRAEAEEIILAAQKMELEAEEIKKRIDAADPIQDAIDIQDLAVQIREAKAINLNAEAWKARQSCEQTVKRLETNSGQMTAEIEQLRQSRKEMIANADMPIEGLSLGDGGIVTMNGLPLDQASTAEQIKTSVALAMASNPKLRVIRIKEGSLLDEDNLELIASMAKEHDYQIWVERVDSSGQVGFFIEDGSVSAVDGVPVEK